MQHSSKKKEKREKHFFSHSIYSFLFVKNKIAKVTHLTFTEKHFNNITIKIKLHAHSVSDMPQTWICCATALKMNDVCMNEYLCVCVCFVNGLVLWVCPSDRLLLPYVWYCSSYSGYVIIFKTHSWIILH